MITTVCMNPSFDKTAMVPKLQPGDLNRLEDVRYDVGGKGINVAVVLRRFGVEAGCVGCLGQADETTFLDMLRREDVPFHYLSLPGKTRTNFKLLDVSTKMVTEFNEPGLCMQPEDRERFIALLKQEAENSRCITFSGSLPTGCQANTYQQLMKALPGKRCVLDADGEALRLGLQEKPFLVKPNLPELEGLAHKELRTLRAIRDAALSLLQCGAQHAVVSMGKYGAMLVDGKKTTFSPALQVEAKSTVGAGDAMLGGMLMALDRGDSLQEAFRCGMAAGAASVLTEGTQLLNVSDFEALLPKVTLQEV